ncbi:MAG TPA: PP2C family protein-serine/threonine phosphatase, partial [Nitrospiraceae bacterium]
SKQKAKGHGQDCRVALVTSGKYHCRQDGADMRSEPMNLVRILTVLMENNPSESSWISKTTPLLALNWREQLNLMNKLLHANEYTELPETRLQSLQLEMDNFESIAETLRPPLSELPILDGIEIAGFTLPLEGQSGGDHIAYIDFHKRCDLPARIREAENHGRSDIVQNLRACETKAGILIADVSGHRRTDAFLVGMLHQAFLMGAFYELEHHGTITPRLFENLSVRFQDLILVGRFITALYGEIASSGLFRFISAGHERPLVFSRRAERFMEIGKANLWQYPPFGTTPFEHIDRARQPHPLLGFQRGYEINMVDLIGVGDTLLICTDGLTDHAANGIPYIGAQLEQRFWECKDRPLQDLARCVESDVREFGPIRDDLSVVMVRKTS